MTTMSTGPLGLSCSSTRRQGPPSVPAWSAAFSGGTPDARLGPHALGGLVRGLLPSWYAMSGPLRRLSAVRRSLVRTCASFADASLERLVFQWESSRDRSLSSAQGPCSSERQ